jgi:glutamine cyclotransferase
MSHKKSVALLTAAILGLFAVSSAPAIAGGAESIGDTLGSFRAPSSWPSGLAWDGTDLWLTDIESESLYRLSMEGVVEAVFPLPDSSRSPAGMTFIGDNLWMVDENTARLFELDTATMQPLKTFRLPDSEYTDATSWGVAWDGQHLWHSQYARGMIFELDTADGSVVSSFAPPDSWIMGIEYDGQYLWGVSQQTGLAFVMSLPSGALVQTYPWQVPYSLGMTLVDGYMWCASGKAPSGTRRVYKVDVGQAALSELPGGLPASRRASAAPNPFRTETRISAGRGFPAIVSARIFDVRGRSVRYLGAVRGAVTWDGTDQAGRYVPAGAYVVCVRLADGSIERQPVRLSR